MTTGRPDYTQSTVIRGRNPSDDLSDVALDASGNVIAVIYGSDGSVLRQILTDALGQIIMVPRGQSGTYLGVDSEGSLSANLKGWDGVSFQTILVDSAGNLIAVVKGLDGATLRTLAVDASGQLVMVPRGNTGNYMAVDASGNLAAAFKGAYGGSLVTVAVDATGHILGVIQGDYAGVLKTLAVDAQGRMLAVLTDPEDVFGNPAYMGAQELAVRLGSIVNFDRRGQVLWMDSFEDGLRHWEQEISGGDGSILPHLYAARSGLVSARLYKNAATANEIGIAKSLPWRQSSRMGLEASLLMDDDPNYVRLSLAVYDGTNVSIGRVRYYPPSGPLQIWDSNGNWATIAATFGTTLAPYSFTTLKLVLNPATHLYSRLLFEGASFDLSARSLQVAAAPGSYYVSIGVRLAQTATNIAELYVDDVILTQNEPA